MLCRVAGFGPADVTLIPTAPPAPRTRERLAERPSAYLLVEVGGVPRALRGDVVDAGGGDAVVVRITDRFRLGQRRMFSRAQLVLPVRVTPLDAEGQPAGEGWRTFTRDVSAGGCRLARQSTYAAAAQHALVIELPRQGASIEARGVVVRESSADLGIRLLGIGPEDRLRLAQAAIAWQRGRLAPARA